MRGVTLLSERPSWIPPTKARGVAAAGLRFENEAAAWLQAQGLAILRNPWIAYGRGRVCSPDFVVFLPEKTLVGECKLTARAGVYNKLTSLYLPLAQSLWGEATAPFGIARHVSGATQCRACFSLLDIARAPITPLPLLVL